MPRSPRPPALPRLPSLKELQRANEECRYDFKQASQILEAMDLLRREAVKTRIPEMIEMIDATFRLLLTTYYCVMRYEMRGLPPSDESLQ
jgi:hypothetical protein